MANTIEAAERLEEQIAKLEDSLLKQEKVVAAMINDGSESAKLMQTNIELLKGVIERNKETVKHIRDTSV